MISKTYGDKSIKILLTFFRRILEWYSIPPKAIQTPGRDAVNNRMLN